MVRLDNVSKRWGYRTILSGITLQIRAGECVAVLGPNGAGKSTLLKLIARLVTPTEGKIELFGEPLAAAAASWRGRVGYLFHQSSFYPHLSAVENLRIVCRWYGIADSSRVIAEALTQVGLRLAKDEKVQIFSRGMVQRLAIARVLLIDPELWLLDEPHTGLDQEGVRWLNGLIRERAAAGAAVLMVSHDLAQVKELSDRVLWLSQGKLTRDISRAEMEELEFQRQVSYV